MKSNVATARFRGNTVCVPIYSLTHESLKDSSGKFFKGKVKVSQIRSSKINIPGITMMIKIINTVDREIFVVKFFVNDLF